MTKIKMCGLSSPCDIGAANRLRPDYAGFVFAPSSKRYVSPEQAAELRRLLHPDVQTVGVFVDAQPDEIVRLCRSEVIGLVQLHGHEDAETVRRLRKLTGRPILQAFRIRTEADAERAESSPADMILLDSGAGTGSTFDWSLIRNVRRPYFLAGGLNPENVGQAVRTLRPFGVDVSSGIETDGRKDPEKMAAFAAAVRKEG